MVLIKIGTLILSFQYILWLAFSAMMGMFEAIYIYFKLNSGKTITGFRFHLHMTLIRSTVAAAILMPFYLQGIRLGGWHMASPLLLALAFIFSFPFLHDGYLYSWANSIWGYERYPGGFLASPDGDAVFDLKWTQRIFLFCLAKICLILYYLYA